ncbi:putative zinc-binding protein [Ornatilinea apprima]|uniref:putative zinc-binding protein n=1 Tax=Ornatilinea apprima TaxID=1134406 RepID=UPI00094665E6|nr:putative zinc-binding protein [Ornatilinea apprima]
MPELPQKKVGIIACSGEEMCEGTVSRLAALKVLEQLRPADTVTICLPLFLAGGQGDRAFAKFYPTIAVDGCEKRCAYRGTEKYSNRPAASIVVSEIMEQEGLEKPRGLRQLNEAGVQLTEVVAEKIAAQVDDLLGKAWSRGKGEFKEAATVVEPVESKEATCSCGSGIPVQTIQVDGHKETLVALPLIFQNIYQVHKAPSEEAIGKILDMVKIYNSLDHTNEVDLNTALTKAYQEFCANQEEQSK